MYLKMHTTQLFDGMETIDAFAIAPWQQLLSHVAYASPERIEAVSRCQEAEETEIQIFTDASMKNGRVGYGILCEAKGLAKCEIQHVIGTSDTINMYIAELGAILEAVEWAERFLRASPGGQGATIYSDSMAALRAIANPP